MREEIPSWNDQWCLENADLTEIESVLFHPGLVSYHTLTVNPRICQVLTITRFTLATSLARSVLPQSYTIPDVVYNMARVTRLTHALGAIPMDPQVISECMEDKLHQ